MSFVPPDIDSAAAARRIRSYVVETPLRRSGWLSQLSGAAVHLKLENQQHTGAFKIRGAANKLLALSSSAASAGVVTASNGNHALAVATMGSKLGIATEVFVSAHIDPARAARIHALHASVRKIDGDYLSAEITARAAAEHSGRTYVSPYNDVQVIEGQGTIAVELLRQLPRMDTVFVAVGGGGLISGIGTHLKRVAPGVEIVGCWPANSPALHECLQAGRIIDVPEEETLSVSTAGGIEAGSVTFDLARRCIDRHVLVSEDQILDALRMTNRHDGLLVEGAAGVALAALRKVAAEYANRTAAIIVCGGNVSATLAHLVCEDS